MTDALHMYGTSPEHDRRSIYVRDFTAHFAYGQLRENSPHRNPRHRREALLEEAAAATLGVTLSEFYRRAALLEQEPYFEEPYDVGYNVAGYELALDPNADPADGPRTYWGVSDADAGLAALLAAGAEPLTEVTEVGDGIRVATVREPGGSTLGIIENPHFALSPPSHSNGPGR